MTDSMTGNLLNRGAPGMSLCDLPAEMLWRICAHANLVSLMRLSATCSAIRYQVHEIFTSRISGQASKYPEVRQSLERLGWKKKHNFWDCRCFKIIAGPGFTWSGLKEDRSFSVLCRSNLSRSSATAAGRLFFMKSNREIYYRQMAESGNMGHNSLRTLVKFNNVVWNVILVTFDNVLAVYFKNFGPHGSVIAYVFNASTLAKVSEINLCNDDDNIYHRNRAISLTRDTMVFHLDTEIQGEHETKIEIWKLSTKDPEKERIALVSTMSHDTVMISKRIWPALQSVCVNDRFIVIFDTVIKVFDRSEEKTLVSQIQIENKTLKAMAMQGGEGDHLALLLKYLNDDGVIKLIVNVYSASRGDLIVRKEFDPLLPIPGMLAPIPGLILQWNLPVYMTWFGDHLIICSQEENSLSLFSWQPGLTCFLNSPFRVPVVRRSPRGNRGHSTIWIGNCLTVDFQGLVTAVYDEGDGFFEKMVQFKTWKASS